MILLHVRIDTYIIQYSITYIMCGYIYIYDINKSILCVWLCIWSFLFYIYTYITLSSWVRKARRNISIRTPIHRLTFEFYTHPWPSYSNRRVVVEGKGFKGVHGLHSIFSLIYDVKILSLILTPLKNYLSNNIFFMRSDLTSLTHLKLKFHFFRLIFKIYFKKEVELTNTYLSLSPRRCQTSMIISKWI